MTPPENEDLARVTQEVAGRLRARGITISQADSSGDIVRLLEAVEAFESAVEAAGGDLMMDEPPDTGDAQPDDPHFLLPPRGSGEALSAYIERLAAATGAARKHKPHS